MKPHWIERLPLRLRPLVRAAAQDSKKPVFQHTVWLLVNNVVLAGLGLVFFVLVASQFPSGAVGRLAALTGAATLVALIARLGLDSVLIRHLPMARAPRRLALRYTAYSVGLAVIIALPWAFINGPFLTQGTVAGTLALPILAAATAASAGFDFALIASRKPGLLVARNAIAGSAKIAAALILIALAHTEPERVLLYAVVLGVGVGALVGLALMARIPARGPDEGVALSPKALAIYGGVNHAATVLAALPSLVLPGLLVVTAGSQTAAYFYVGSTIAGLGLVLPYALGQAVFVDAAHSQRSTVASLRRLRNLVAIGTAVGILLAAFLPIVLPLLGKEYAANAFGIAAVMLLSTPFVVVTTLYVVELRHTASSVALIVFAGGLAVSTVIGTIVGALIGGTSGLAVGWAAPQVLFGIFAGERMIRNARRVND